MADDPDIPTVTVRQWIDVVRRARLGRTVTAVALMMASYADFRTGRRVRPGLARLAYEAELHYSSAKKATAELRRVGLLLLVKRASSYGDCDEYRLILGPQLIDLVDVPTPAAEEVAIERIRNVQRKRPQAAAPPVDESVAQAPAPPVADEPQAPAPPVEPAGAPDSTGDAPARSSAPTGGGDVSPQAAPPPGISQDQPQTPTNSLDVGSNHQTARDSTASTSTSPAEHTPPALPTRCPHGLPARRRPDGASSCALCRRDATAGDDDPPPGPPALHLVQTA